MGCIICLFFYKNYNGGINNLCVVSDANGNYATSLKSKEQAVKNYIRKVKKFKK